MRHASADSALWTALVLAVVAAAASTAWAHTDHETAPVRTLLALGRIAQYESFVEELRLP